MPGSLWVRPVSFPTALMPHSDWISGNLQSSSVLWAGTACAFCLYHKEMKGMGRSAEWNLEMWLINIWTALLPCASSEKPGLSFEPVISCYIDKEKGAS